MSKIKIVSVEPQKFYFSGRVATRYQLSSGLGYLFYVNDDKIIKFDTPIPLVAITHIRPTSNHRILVKKMPGSQKTSNQQFLRMKW